MSSIKWLFAALFLFLCVYHLSFAQTPKVTSTPEYAHPSKNEYIEKYVGKISGKHLFLRRGKKYNILFLESYNGDFQPAGKNELIQPLVKGTPLLLWDVVIAKNKLIALYTFPDIKANIRGVYAHELDPQTARPVAEPKLLIDLPGADYVNYGDYLLSFSSDSSMFVLASRQPEKGGSEFAVGVFDLGLNKILEKKIGLTRGGAKSYTVNQVLIDKTKTLFINALVSYPYEKDKTRQQSEIYVSGNALEKVNFSLGEYFPIVVLLKLVNGSVIGAGTISDNLEKYGSYRNNSLQNNQYLANGMMYFWWDAGKGRLDAVQKKMFAPSFIEENATRFNKGSIGIPYLKVKSVLLTPANDIVAATEMNFNDRERMGTSYGQVGDGAPMQQNVYTAFTYGNIIVSSMSKDGARNWINLLPKFQMTVYEAKGVLANREGTKTANFMVYNNSYPSEYTVYFGFKLIQDKDRIHIIYNDDPGNFSKTGPEKKNPEKFKGDDAYNTILATIDGNGKIQEEVLLSSKDKTYSTPPVPAFIEQNPVPGEVLLYGALGEKKYRFIKVRF